jgi:MarR family 2-MHQ and catechol resistance regulon transcriptional repressor
VAKTELKSNMSLNEKVLISIVRTSELFKNKISNLFKNYGLTFSQYNVLRILEVSENGQDTITNVSKILVVSGSNMTGVAKRLERGGFLIRKSDPNDERITLLEITPKGKQTLKNLEEEKDKIESIYLEDHTDEQKNVLLSSLSQIRSKVES